MRHHRLRRHPGHRPRSHRRPAASRVPRLRFGRDRRPQRRPGSSGGGSRARVRDLAEEVRRHPIAGACGIGHTRWATHGRPSEDNAHPHTDCSGTIALVHNGIVENYWSLKEKLRAEGHVFRTETDTEVIVHLVEKHFHGSLEEALRAAVNELEGAFAVACISSRDPGKIVAARNGPPVVVGFGSGETFLSSDITPLLAHTRRVAYLDDGEIAVLTAAGDPLRHLRRGARSKRPSRPWTGSRP